MIQIPKNVMQIGEVNPHTKIYMEDYVHTFLERRKKAEEYLAFGKKEERGDVLYYLIYGVEKRTDWDRGSYPYFKKYERIGTIEGAADRLVFKPVRGSGIALDGFFIFYEQNEDMQSYMIVVRENEEIAGSEEPEQVMEAVKSRREQQKKALEAAESHEEKERREKLPSAGTEGKERRSTARAKNTDGIVQSLQRKAKKNAGIAFRKKEQSGAGISFRRKEQSGAGISFRRKEQSGAGISFRKKEQNSAAKRKTQQAERSGIHTWSIPDLCRAGCMVLLLVLVAFGLTSVNRYPDMKAVTELFSDALKAVTGEKEEAVAVDAAAQQDGLIVEEITAGQDVEEAVMEEAETGDELILAQDGGGSIQWTIGQNMQEENGSLAETGEQQEENAQPVISGSEGNGAQSGDAGQNGDGAQPNTAETAASSGDRTDGDGAAEEKIPRTDDVPAEESGETPGSGEASGRADDSAQAQTETAEAAESAEEDATQAIARPVSYVVKKGDSLAQIARKFYGNASMVWEICDVNQIENPDQIHPGQNILLP